LRLRRLNESENEQSNAEKTKDNRYPNGVIMLSDMHFLAEIGLCFIQAVEDLFIAYDLPGAVRNGHPVALIVNEAARDRSAAAGGQQDSGKDDQTYFLHK
jgi:hypothetical protein